MIAVRAGDRQFFAQVVREPPVDTTYRFGLWHENRFRASSYGAELRLYAKALLRRRTTPHRKVLIIARARSGTTLLVDLLRSHPDIHCDNEYLRNGKLSPAGTLIARAGQVDAPVYGAKLLSFQMAQVHRMRNPVAFLSRLSAAGFTFIHLERSTIHQVISLAAAQMLRRYHNRGDYAETRKIRLDPAEFAHRLRWSELLLEYERRALSYFDPWRLTYERDLAEPEQQQRTANRLFTALGLDPCPIHPRVRKLLPKSIADIVENADDLPTDLRTLGRPRIV